MALPDWVKDNFNLDEVEPLETDKGWIVVEPNDDGTSDITLEEDEGLVTYHRCYPVAYNSSSSGEPLREDDIIMEVEL